MKRSSLFLMGVVLVSLIMGIEAIFGEAINSGYVIAYGKYVEKPYDVIVEGEKLLVNGIQILPYPTEPEKPEVTEAKKFAHDCREKYFNWKEKHGEKKARQMLHKYLSNEPRVKTFEFTDERVTRVIVEFDNGVKKNVFYTRAPLSQYEIVYPLDRKFVAQYKEWFKKYGKAKAREMIKDALSKESLVEKFKIDNSTFYILYKNGIDTNIEGGANALEIAAMKRSKTEAERKEERLKALEYDRSTIVRYLKNGKLIIFCRGTWHFYPRGRSETVFDGINEIMSSDDNLSKKRELLKELIVDPSGDTSEEILKNYKVKRIRRKKP